MMESDINSIFWYKKDRIFQMKKKQLHKNMFSKKIKNFPKF